jgi:hypothetical protein
MTSSSNFPRFDGLMDLAKREGVDIRPTLLRVLTDLYVQSPLHTDGEEQQYVELASRLIDEVDDATRAAVRSRLAIYPNAPTALLHQLEVFRAPSPPLVPEGPPAPVMPPQPRRETPAALAPQVEIGTIQIENIQTLGQIETIQTLSETFFAASSAQRTEIMRRLDTVRLPTIPRISTVRAATVVESLEHAAMQDDRAKFCFELAEALILPRVHVNRIVDDPNGEPLVLALKLLAMPAAVFQRIAMFMAEQGETYVERVFRMSRLYDAITFHDANVMLAAWRASSISAVRTQHRGYLYDDESSRARSAPAATRTERPAMAPARPSRTAV